MHFSVSGHSQWTIVLQFHFSQSRTGKPPLISFHDRIYGDPDKF